MASTVTSVSHGEGTGLVLVSGCLLIDRTVLAQVSAQDIKARTEEVLLGIEQILKDASVALASQNKPGPPGTPQANPKDGCRPTSLAPGASPDTQPSAGLGPSAPGPHAASPSSAECPVDEAQTQPQPQPQGTPPGSLNGTPAGFPPGAPNSAATQEPALPQPSAAAAFSAPDAGNGPSTPSAPSAPSAQPRLTTPSAPAGTAPPAQAHSPSDTSAELSATVVCWLGPTPAAGGPASSPSGAACAPSRPAGSAPKAQRPTPPAVPIPSSLPLPSDSIPTLTEAPLDKAPLPSLQSERPGLTPLPPAPTVPSPQLLLTASCVSWAHNPPHCAAGPHPSRAASAAGASSDAAAAHAVGTNGTPHCAEKSPGAGEARVTEWAAGGGVPGGCRAGLKDARGKGNEGVKAQEADRKAGRGESAEQGAAATGTGDPVVGWEVGTGKALGGGGRNQGQAVAVSPSTADGWADGARKRRLGGASDEVCLAAAGAAGGGREEDEDEEEEREDLYGRHICPAAGCRKSFSSKDRLYKHEAKVHHKRARLYVCDRPKLTGGACDFSTYDAGKMSNHKKYSLVHNRREDFKFSCHACLHRFPRRHELDRHTTACKKLKERERLQTAATPNQHHNQQLIQNHSQQPPQNQLQQLLLQPQRASQQQEGVLTIPEQGVGDAEARLAEGLTEEDNDDVVLLCGPAGAGQEQRLVRRAGWEEEQRGWYSELTEGYGGELQMLQQQQQHIGVAGGEAQWGTSGVEHGGQEMKRARKQGAVCAAVVHSSQRLRPEESEYPLSPHITAPSSYAWSEADGRVGQARDSCGSRRDLNLGLRIPPSTPAGAHRGRDIDPLTLTACSGGSRGAAARGGGLVGPGCTRPEGGGGLAGAPGAGSGYWPVQSGAARLYSGSSPGGGSGPWTLPIAPHGQKLQQQQQQQHRPCSPVGGARGAAGARSTQSARRGNQQGAEEVHWAAQYGSPGAHSAAHAGQHRAHNPLSASRSLHPLSAPQSETRVICKSEPLSPTGSAPSMDVELRLGSSPLSIPPTDRNPHSQGHGARLRL